MPLNPGQILQERYRIDALLGQGGMGAVYRATDLRFDAPVAIKENRMVAPESQAQFGREAGLLYRLRHPNLPRVIDHFYLPGQGQYLVMDYVPGQDLKSVLERRGALPQAQALALLDQVLDALAYLHGLGIVHRDVKPANVKITPEDKVFLVDFGLAKVHDPAQETTIGARGVTPGYAPAEQYGMGRTDARTDVYSAGATLYVLLTGQPPPDALECVTGQARLVPPREIRPQIPAALETVILRAMQSRPGDRFPTVAEFRSALQRAAAGQEPRGRVPEPGPHLARASAKRAASQRRGAVAGLLGLLAVITVVALGFAAWKLLAPGGDTPDPATPQLGSAVVPAAGTLAVAVVTATKNPAPSPSPTAARTETPVPSPMPPPRLDGMPGNWLPDQEDFPADMYLADGGQVSNEEISEQYDDPAEMLARLEGWGRLTGYYEDYLHEDGCSSTAGLREVFVEAVLHETAAGAREYTEWGKAQRISGSMRVEDKGSLGDGAYAYWYETQSDCSPPDTLRYVGINFHRFNAAGVVAIGSVADTMDDEELEAIAVWLAGRMDERFLEEARSPD